ncbi:MAG: TetR family transcriptional regulator [Microbacterium sp.]
MPDAPAPRRRGRPPAAASGATRQRILAAATDEFGASGYDATTIRGIAERAGVDAALVHHYFGTKADLFAAVVGAPLRPDIAVRVMLEGPRDDLGESIVRYVLEIWEQPDVQRRGVALLRTAIGNRAMTPLLAGFLSRELLGRIATELAVPDAELRATLAASQVAGLLAMRYILRLPAMTSASVDELVERIGPTIQRYLAG